RRERPDPGTLSPHWSSVVMQDHRGRRPAHAARHNEEETPTMATASDYIVDTLFASGVRRIHGIAGDSLNGLTEALRDRPELEWIQVRHEEAAAFAASAEAGLTGELAVCAGSCGPGNLHLVNGLYDAQRSR